MASNDRLYPVPVYKQNHGFVKVENEATKGATIGQDLLFLNDGIAGARELGISTGLLEGGKITINSDPTKIDIAAGRALFVDFSASEPTVVTKEFGPYTGVTIEDIAIQPVTYISIDSDLNIVQTSAELTNAQRRSMVELGIAVHTNNTTVNVINTLAQTIESTAAQLHDFMEAVGPFNKSGNVYSPAGANLQIQKTAGDIFKFGVAYDITPHDPHTIDQVSVNPVTFRYRLRDSTEYTDRNTIDPNNYDLNGVLTAVQANRYTVQRVYMFQSGLTRIQYGQAEYQTMSEAIGTFEKEVFETELNMRTNGIPRAFIVIKQGATNLSDPAQAQFFDVSKFGTPSGAGGGGVDAATIIAALGYTPANQARQIIAGAGLTGGGDLSADRTINVGTPSSVTSTSTNSTTADSHTHALVINDGSLSIAKTSGLQAALDSKVDDSQVGVANGVASLDSGGKIPSAQLPTLAITEVYTVASQAAMLALAADEGDVAIRTDLSPTRAYILIQSPASTLANWQDITGSYTDWSQITNKPATFTPSAHTHSIADVTNLQTTLDTKATRAHLAGTSGYFSLFSYSASYGEGKMESYYDANNARWNINARDAANAVTDVELRVNGTITEKGSRVWTAATFSPASKADASTTITAGNGLTGGGDLSANRTVALGTPNTLTPATANAVTSTSHTHTVEMVVGKTQATDAATTYPAKNVVAVDVSLGAGWPAGNGTAIMAHADTAGNRVMQLFSPIKGGTGVPELYLRTSHSSDNGGGWTGFYKVHHEGNFDPTNIPTQVGDLLVSKANAIIGIGASGSRNGGLANYAAAGTGDVGIFSEYAGGRVRIRPDGRTSAVGEMIVQASGPTFDGNSMWHSGNAPIAEASTVSTLAKRNSSGDIFARLFRSEFANQTSISGAMAFRINNTTDNYIRFCSDTAAIRTWMGVMAAASPTATGNLTLSSSGNEFYRANANSTTTTRQPRTFVQSGDPGAAAADGDLWIW